MFVLINFVPESHNPRALAVSLTFFPCGGCFVYWLYKAEGDWNVSSIPTVVGWVDPRRLAAYSFGMGSSACNIDALSSSSMDSCQGTILCAPREMLLQIVRLGNPTDNADCSGASAKDNISRVDTDIQRLKRGEDLHELSSSSSEEEGDQDTNERDIES